LLEHITERRWREVFLLTAGMMRKADNFIQLMKYKIDELISTDEQLQNVMQWVAQKSSLAKVPYQPAEVRGIYLGLINSYILGKRSDFRYLPRILAFDLALTGNSDNNFYQTCSPGAIGIITSGLSFEVTVFFERKKIRASRLCLDMSYPNYFNLNFDFDLEHNPNPQLQILLDNLKSQFPPPQNESKAFKCWYKTDGQVWTEQLRKVMIEHCDIGHNWQFNETQKMLLGQYYYANKLLMDCLNSDCYINREVRQEIENTLLLPNEN